MSTTSFSDPSNDPTKLDPERLVAAAQQVRSAQEAYTRAETALRLARNNVMTAQEEMETARHRLSEANHVLDAETLRGMSVRFGNGWRVF